MRFLGPRSIASSVKTALDVVYYGLHAAILVAVLAALCVLTVPNIAAETARRMNITTEPTAGSQALIMVAFALGLTGYLLITRWTRQVFRTLADGDVFHLDNVRRLRWIGFGLGGLELFGYAVRVAGEGMLHLHFEPVYGLRAVTTWFSVLVVFVLAEVFKEGARLRQEADLTI